MTDAPNIDPRTAQVAFRAHGTMAVLTNKMSVFTATATLGHYRATDQTRQELHADLDNVLDAALDQNRLLRMNAGLK